MRISDTPFPTVSHADAKPREGRLGRGLLAVPARWFGSICRWIRLWAEKLNSWPSGWLFVQTETSYKSLRLSLGRWNSSLCTPLQTQRSGVAARISPDAKASSSPFSWRFFIVYCAALWRLCAGYLRVCRLFRRIGPRTCVQLPPPSCRGDQWQLLFTSPELHND